MIKSKEILLKLFFLTFINGILLFLSFPKFGHFSVAWMSFIPVFYLINLMGDNFQYVLLSSFITGIIFNIGIFYWIVIALVKYCYLSLIFSIIALFLIAIILSSYFVLFSICFYFLNRKKIPIFFFAPPLWTLIEYIKSNLIIKFPWANLGYSQINNIYFIQILDILGIYGISFLIIFINCLLYNIFQKELSKCKIIINIIIIIIILVTVYFYGSFKLKLIKSVFYKKPKFKITIIQGNIDQKIKWNNSFKNQHLNQLLQLSSSKKKKNPGLIIWPETSVPFFFQELNKFHYNLCNLAKNRNDYFIFGSPSYYYNNILKCKFYMNSAFIISNKGNILARYDKVRLVPFGEYIPCNFLLSNNFKKKLPGIKNFIPGNKHFLINLNNKKIGILICYESIFPEISRIYKNLGSQLIINLTNDAWYDNSSEPYQHLGMLVFRAIENRIYVARSANSGISAIINPLGEIIINTKLLESTKLESSICFLNIKTIYSRFGDWPVLLSIIILFIIMIHICCGF